MPKYVSIANIFIDDILFWDGRMYLGVLGGAGSHAVSGMRVWSDDIGLFARAGKDLTQEHRDQLLELGLDLSGILFNSERTARAWQIFHPNERRIEIYRFPDGANDKRTPSFVGLPPSYRSAQGYHIYWDGELLQLKEEILRLRADNPSAVMVWEPAERHMHDDPVDFRSVLPLVNIFSPNELEGTAITGLSDPREICECFSTWGAKCIALRMGKEGSLAREADGRYHKIPAFVSSLPVDVTGAGNAYCGGLTVSLAEGYSLFESACRAAVSASFSLEQYGMPKFTGNHLADERQKRLNWILDEAKLINT